MYVCDVPYNNANLTVIHANIIGVNTYNLTSCTPKDCTTTFIYGKLLYLMYLSCIYADVLTINDDVC